MEIASSKIRLRTNESNAIQALRFIAAFLVYMQHIFAFAGGIKPGVNLDWFWPLRFGSIGVGVFFVISGFIMSMKLDDPPSEFLAKRLIRVYPSFWLFAAISLVLQYAILTRFVPPQAATLFLFPSNIPDGSLYIPSWTLVYEVIFYVLCFVVCGAKWLRPALPYLLLAWFGAIELKDVYFGEVSHASATASQILLSRMNIYFVVGMLLGLYGHRIKLPSLAYAALFALAFGNTLHSPSILHYETFSAISYAFVILLLLKLPFTSKAGKLVAKMGDYSYGIYLAHLPLIFITAEIMKQTHWRFSVTLLTLVFFTLIPTIVLAIGEHRFHKWISSATMRGLLMSRSGERNSTKTPHKNYVHDVNIP